MADEIDRRLAVCIEFLQRHREIIERQVVSLDRRIAQFDAGQRDLPPKRIWLLLGEGEQGSHIWSDDPKPSGSGNHIAVEYLRADCLTGGSFDND